MFLKKRRYLFIMLSPALLFVPSWYIILKSDIFEDSKHGLKSEKKIKVGVLIPSTTRGIRFQGIEKFSLFKISLPSFYKTMQTEYDYTIYVGIDINDTLNSCIHDIEGFGDNIIVVRVNGSTFTKAVNTIAEKAVQDGADYLVRVNDDTQFVTNKWTSLCIESLQSFEPPNIGVVGPLCLRDKETILTQDFVHVTHFHIFGFYYPPQLDNWWADDWITLVYEPSRSKRLLAWEVKHFRREKRYRVKVRQQNLLEPLISGGKKTLTSYINSSVSDNITINNKLL
ncbi:hypothetical protein ACF0H5_008681 [Mactra antiquata]